MVNAFLTKEIQITGQLVSAGLKETIIR